jgi:hypothetical protein
VAGAAGHDALAIFGTDEEGTFLEAGDYGDAGCMHGDRVRDTAVGSCHKFVQNLVGGFNALVKLSFVSGMGREAEGEDCGGTDTSQ